MIDLDLDFLRSYAQAHPNPWGTSQPHNAYKGMNLLQRRVIGHKTRLESGQITPQSVFHLSVMYSPAQRKLQSPNYMITLDMIRWSFGYDLAQYPALNEFEQYCKDYWSTGVCGPSKFVFSTTDPVIYSLVLLRPAAPKILEFLPGLNG